MKRTQIQLDESTYQALRRRAYEEQCSISALARRILSRALAPATRRKATAGRFSFVGAGRSRQGQLAPVSERHDEALAEATSPRKKR
jgi:plasmid stability protein